MKLNKLAGAAIAIVLLAGVGLSGTLALADTAPAAAPTPPVGLSVADLNNQSQSNIAMAQMLFKLGQMQGELASLKQQQEAGALDAKKVADQLKTAQDGLKASQARVTELSKPRCDDASSLSHSAPTATFEQKFTVSPSKKK
jgi:hypothetical protein